MNHKDLIKYLLRTFQGDADGVLWWFEKNGSVESEDTLINEIAEVLMEGY